MTIQDTVKNLTDQHHIAYRTAAAELGTLTRALMACTPPGCEAADAARIVLGSVIPPLIAVLGRDRTAALLEELAHGLRQMKQETRT